MAGYNRPAAYLGYRTGQVNSVSCEQLILLDITGWQLTWVIEQDRSTV